MKTTLLVYVGAPFLLLSCVGTSNSNESDLSVDEMKARVKAEEIHFEKEIKDSSPEIAPILMEKIGSIDDMGCTLPKSELKSGLVDSLPELIAWPRYPPDPNERIFVIPEIDAQYPGGVLEMKKFINSNLIYPDRFIDVKGVVYVSFVIEKDGSVSNAEIARGIGKDYDQEALRVVNLMPNWIPAEYKGKIVASKVRMPIRFTLN